MSSSNKVIYNEKEYDNITEFNCKVVHVGYKEGGSFMTCIPISNLSYRKKHKTLASVNIVKNKTHTIFTITDDWGSDNHVMKIPNNMELEIINATKWATKQKLLNPQP